MYITANGTAYAAPLVDVVVVAPDSCCMAALFSPLMTCTFTLSGSVINRREQMELTKGRSAGVRLSMRPPDALLHRIRNANLDTGREWDYLAWQ